MRRNMPDPLPVLLLGRLAVDRRYHNQGIGQALLRDAMIRAVNVAGNAGVFALLVHALSDQARQFYLSRGFLESPLQPMTLLMTIETVRSILVEPD
jgi:GNAT superfamily N-acetyltransferase